MRRIACSAAFLASLAIGVAPTIAQHLGVPPGRWWERPRIAAQLALSTEQKEKLNNETFAHARALVDLKAAVEKAEIDLRASAESDPFNGKAAREAFRSLQTTRQRLEAERFEMLVKVREVLTHEQWLKLRSLAVTLLRERRERGNQPDSPEQQPRRHW
jgi:Spy/CpxP family protein refolding chaperone